MEIREAITSSYLAAGLSADFIDRLCQIALIRDYESGDAIMRQFDKESDLMILIEGKAEVISVIGEPVGAIHPGLVFGEMSLIDGRPRSATILSRGHSRAVVFPAEALKALVKEMPDAGLRALLNISRLLCARLRSLNQEVAVSMALEDIH